MPIKDSRLKNGTLTIDGLPFATQATNVELEPDTDEDGDRLEVLSGDVIEPDDETTWTLNIEAVQDFDDPTGFVNYAFDHAGELVPFTWKPNDGSPTWSGEVKVRPVTIGGDVATRNTTSAEWPVTGTPLRTPDPA